MSGCTKPVKKTEQEIKDIDALALQNCYAQGAGGGGTTTYNSTQTGVATSLACGQQAANASRDAQNGDETKRSINRDLPVELVLQENPFEEDGRMHNAILDIYFEYSQQEDFNTALKNYSVEAFTKIFNKSKYKDIYFSQPNKVVDELKANGIIEKISQSVAITTTNQDVLNFNAYINNQCKKMLLDGYSKYKRAEFINKEIINILKTVDPEVGFSSEQTLKIVYATTYKYSMYYWNDEL